MKALLSRQWVRYGCFIVTLLLVLGLSLVVGRRWGFQVGSAFGALLVFTPIVFGVPITNQRQYWHHRSYWLAVATLFVIHVVAFMSVLISHPGWRAVWVTLAAAVEAGIVAALLELVFGRTEPRRDKLV